MNLGLILRSKNAIIDQGLIISSDTKMFTKTIQVFGIPQVLIFNEYAIALQVILCHLLDALDEQFD